MPIEMSSIFKGGHLKLFDGSEWNACIHHANSGDDKPETISNGKSAYRQRSFADQMSVSHSESKYFSSPSRRR